MDGDKLVEQFQLMVKPYIGKMVLLRERATRLVEMAKKQQALLATTSGREKADWASHLTDVAQTPVDLLQESMMELITLESSIDGFLHGRKPEDQEELLMQAMACRSNIMTEFETILRCARVVTDSSALALETARKAGTQFKVILRDH